MLDALDVWHQGRSWCAENISCREFLQMCSHWRSRTLASWDLSDLAQVKPLRLESQAMPPRQVSEATPALHAASALVDSDTEVSTSALIFNFCTYLQVEGPWRWQQRWLWRLAGGPACSLGCQRPCLDLASNLFWHMLHSGQIILEMWLLSC